MIYYIQRYESELRSALNVPSFDIVEEEDTHIEIRTDSVRLTIGYDPRDGILVSMIEPLGVPADIAEQCQVWTLLRMMNFMDDDEELKSNYIKDLPREIVNIGIVMRGIFLAGPQRIRDALHFCAGYDAGYTDRFT